MNNIAIKKSNGKFHIIENEDTLKFKKYGKETIANIKVDNKGMYWLDGVCIGKDLSKAQSKGFTDLELFLE